MTGEVWAVRRTKLDLGWGDKTGMRHDHPDGGRVPREWRWDKTGKTSHVQDGRALSTKTRALRCTFPQGPYLQRTGSGNIQS